MGKIETTFADLRPTDRIVAKDGTAWPIADLVVTGDADGAVADFWLCDPQTKQRLHSMSRDIQADVTVERIPTHADDVAKAEAEFPCDHQWTNSDPELFTNNLRRCVKCHLTAPDDVAKAEAEFLEAGAVRSDEIVAKAMFPLAEELGATVEAEVTAEETDAARQATEEQPVELPAFESMTGLEQRSHMYLLHGVIAYDLQSKATLEQTHTQAHADYAAGKLKSRQIPHRHGEAL